MTLKVWSQTVLVSQYWFQEREREVAAWSLYIHHILHKQKLLFLFYFTLPSTNINM